MRRSDSGKLRNLPKLCHMSSLPQCWLARRLAQTVPTASQRVCSCLPSSAHQPNKTPLSELTTAGQQHQLHRWSGPPQTDAHGHAPQGHPSWFPPPLVAPAHPRFTDSRGNPARATQVFQDAGAAHGQSDECFGNAVTLHVSHMWARTHSYGIPGSKNGLAYWQRLLVLWRRTCQAQWPHILSSRAKISWTKISGALSGVCLICTSLRRHNFCGLCDVICFNLSSTSFNSVNMKTYIAYQIRLLLNQIEARIANYSSKETTIVLSPPRKRSSTRTPSDDQWHKTQWQQDRWKTDLKGKNLVKFWSQHGTILVRGNYWTQILPSWNACSNNFRLRPQRWTASGTSCWGPQSTVPGSW